MTPTPYTLKSSALAALRRRYAEQRGQVLGIESRLADYFDGLVTVELNADADPQDPQPAHNIYELLGGLKFLRLLRTYPFNVRKVHQVIRLREGIWQQNARGRWQHVKGGIRQPLTTGDAVLRWEPFQVFILASIYGFHAWIPTGATEEEKPDLLPSERVRDGMVEDLRRLCIEYALFGPRKIDKTGISAFVAQEHFLLEDPNSESYCCANSEDQSKLLFRRIKHGLLQLNFDNRWRITETVIDWRERYQRDGHTSSIRPLSAGGKTKDGLFGQLCCRDEYGSAGYTNGKSDMKRLCDVVMSSMGPRREPLTVTTTTAGRITSGPFIEELESLHRLLEMELEWDTGDEKPPLSYDRSLCLLLEPDEWERQTEETLLTSKAVRRKINPMLGKIVQYQFYDDAVAKVRMDGDLGEVKTKLFNVYESATVKDWFRPEDIRPLQLDMRIDDCVDTAGWVVFTGMDFSKGDDLNGNGYLAFNTQTGYFFGDMDVYMSEDAVRKNPICELLWKWADQGWLHIVPGKTFDPAWPVNRIVELHNKGVNFMSFGYDPFNAKMVVNAMSQWVYDLGRDPKTIILPVRQNFATYNPAVSQFDYLVKHSIIDPETGHEKPCPLIHFSSNPLWPYCFGCTMLQESNDGMENFKPVKKDHSPSTKVDPVQMLLSGIILYDMAEEQLQY